MPSHLGYGMHVPYLDRAPKAQTDYHTLTNLPFKPSSKIHHRYDHMNRPSSAGLPFLMKGGGGEQTAPGTAVGAAGRSPRASVIGLVEVVDDDEFRQNGVEYAKFLKDHERTLGPTGFLDSARYTHTYNVKSLNLQRAGQAPRTEREPTTVVALTNRIAADQKEFDKKMKVIEDHMWQHKQEERELKRVEGDVTKKKRAVQRITREFENSMSKKMLEEEKRLNESIQQTEKVRAEGVHAREERTKMRITKAHGDLQQAKSKMRKSALVVTDAERLYRSKLTELEMRKDQIHRLTRQFEDKLKRQENEAHNLGKELAGLAIQMNMESMKGKTADVELRRQERVQAEKYITEEKTHVSELERKLSKSDGIYRASENRRRQASATLASTKAHLSERGREGDRRVTDNRNLVESNIAAQKKLQEAAEAADLDKRRKEYQRDVQSHVLRKRITLKRASTARKSAASEREETWEKAFESNHREFVRRRNEDLLRTFNRVVQHDNEMDHKLYQKCRELEHECKSSEQATRKLEDQLIKMRRRGQSKMRETVHSADDKEVEVEKKLKLSRAMLTRAQNQRSTAEWMLRKYRGTAKETEYIHTELNREHKRLMKIGAKTDGYLEQQPIPVM